MATQIVEFVLKYPEFGWVLVLVYMLIEVRHPRGRIRKLDKKITNNTIVIRAISRVTEGIREKEVDDYLVENGMEPEDFLSKEKHSNDESDSEREACLTETAQAVADSQKSVNMNKFTEASEDDD